MPTGSVYHPSVPGMNALGAGRPSVGFGLPLRPGDHYDTSLVFDLPSDARNPRLWVADRIPEAFFMIGHENSPFHERVLFALEPEASGRTVQKLCKSS